MITCCVLWEETCVNSLRIWMRSTASSASLTRWGVLFCFFAFIHFTVFALVQEMNAPSFRVERDPNGALLLHYYSDRRGLCQIVPGIPKHFLCHKYLFYSQFGIILLQILITVIGIIAAVAKDFFDSDVTMEVINQLEELERTGKKEHVVFLVSEQPRARHRKDPITETPCTLVGRRNAEVSQGKSWRSQWGHWNVNPVLSASAGGSAREDHRQQRQRPLGSDSRAGSAWKR